MNKPSTKTSKNGNAVASKAAVKAATKAATKPATKVAAKTNGKATKAAAVKKATKRAAVALKEIFGHSVSSVARALHAAGMKPNEVIRAIHSVEPKAKEGSVRGCCRTGQKAAKEMAVAELNKKQLAALKKAGAAPVEVAVAA